MRVLIILCMLFSLSGCLATAPYWVRRAVVHDDMIFIKETGVLCRRYIPDGPLLKPNKAVIAQVGAITASNDKIIVFGSYQNAVESGIEFTPDDTIRDDIEYYEKRKNGEINPMEE